MPASKTQTSQEMTNKLQPANAMTDSLIESNVPQVDQTGHNNSWWTSKPSTHRPMIQWA